MKSSHREIHNSLVFQPFEARFFKKSFVNGGHIIRGVEVPGKFGLLLPGQCIVIDWRLLSSYAEQSSEHSNTRVFHSEMLIQGGSSVNLSQGSIPAA